MYIGHRLLPLTQNRCSLLALEFCSNDTGTTITQRDINISSKALITTVILHPKFAKAALLVTGYPFIAIILL